MTAAAATISTGTDASVLTLRRGLAILDAFGNQPRHLGSTRSRVW